MCLNWLETVTVPYSKPLWLTRERRDELARRIASGDPVALAILARAELSADPSATESVDGENAVALAILALARNDAARAAAACDAILPLVNPAGGELGRANVALICAAIHDACYDQLDETRRLALNQALYTLCRGFLEADIAHGDPHIVTNNHWAVAHAGAAIAAMAIHGFPRGDGSTCDMTEAIAWAVSRVKPFLMHHGDRGLYHEGLGYQLYPAAFWLPCLLAVRNVLGTDWLAEFPSLRQTPASIYAGVALRRHNLRSGIKLSWNDDGMEWCNRNSSILLLSIAPPGQLGALRWMYDRLNGIHGDGLFNPDHAGLFFSFLYYPYDVPAREPAGILPLRLTDSRQGLCILRNRYRDADDSLVGAYARVTHVGGHAHDDAGSLRCMALGHDWIIGGGQDRGEAEYQSLVTAADTPRAKPFGCGAIIADDSAPSGGVFGMDLRRPVIGYAERWLAVNFSGAGGTEAALAILDLLDDHLERDWNWNLSFGADLTARLHADGAGFDLAAADGPAATLRFLGPAPARLELRRMRDSRRTFQGGHTETYPGGPFIQARFPHAKHTVIYAVMAIARHAPPAPATDGGLDVRLGAETWRRPFGAAIPPAFSLARGGTLCRYPNGELRG